jgi:hypothetical protein
MDPVKLRRRSGRRYERALAAAGLEAATEPARPPPGAPAVRGAPARQRKPPAALETALESTADSLLLVNAPDGSCAFEIAIKDDVFDELACRIALRDHRVTAIFRARDPHLRRLLEAESGRLRALLADRGLHVSAIVVSDA